MAGRNEGDEYVSPGGQVNFWIADEAIHIKAIDPSYNDPTEVTADEARNIAQALIRMADILDQI